MRGYRLLIPADGVASQTVRENMSALRVMQTVLTADIRPSTALDLPHGLASTRPQWRGLVEAARHVVAACPAHPASSDHGRRQGNSCCWSAGPPWSHRRWFWPPALIRGEAWSRGTGGLHTLSCP